MSNKSRLILFTVFAITALVALFNAWKHFGTPAPAPSIPPHIAKLDPQLRLHLSNLVARVHDSPRNAEAHALLGTAYAANSLWTDAERQFQNAYKLDPREPLALMYTGVAALELGRLENARAIFQQLVQRFPKFPQGYYRLGHVSLRKGALDEAERAFNRLMELAPNEWRGFAGLAEVKLKTGKPHEAVPLLKKALALDPSSKKAHFLLGTAYRDLGVKDKAEEELALGADLSDSPMSDPWAAKAFYHMMALPDQLEIADNLSQSGHPLRAAWLLQEALKYHPTNVTLLNNLAIAYNLAQKPDLALPLLQSALLLQSNYLPARLTLCHTWTALGRTHEALQLAESIISAEPNLPQPWLAKANVLLAQERDNDTIAALQQAASLDPANAEIKLELGDVFWKNLDDTDNALKQYQAAIEAAPAFAPAFQRLADLQEHLGMTNEAAANYKKADRLAQAQLP